ncbi:GAF domain-containing protein [Geoalkalibacter halelectricus]|uniref:GAF domain-containing protein n=1 Tax=Geoalkalibacter halelectricus TaxID=2847045 RepID=A0ABY5ZPT0_9BACT|nr:GAF domain-containing protein [Geoalkalibacter halelectricus]MDO3376909.1 GAF domain-containing protein [Geoalkalibacter halelectricus]UWZ81133.1 GAF domain-containing protein [Geoalkalibacter halelectricus]
MSQEFDTSFVKILGLANFLEQQGRLDENLGTLAALAAEVLASRNCSIMLLREERGTSCMKIFASHGYLPPVAFTERARHREGIAGQVAASGEALLVPDIRQSPYADRARWPDKDARGFISAPIFIGREVLGVININTPLDGRTYGEKDLQLLVLVALMVGKSIQVVQLQNLLKSRFAQQALLHSAQDAMDQSLALAVQNPAKTARIVGKAFYREMNQAGFADDHIIQAATEIISLLSQKLRKHSRRRDKNPS